MPDLAQLIVALLLLAAGSGPPFGTVNASETRRLADCAEVDRYVGHVPGHLDRVWALRCA